MKIKGLVLINSSHYDKTTNEVIDWLHHYGRKSTQVNIEHFTKSVNFNNCLNKKISIDTKGEIRNCPSMKQSFGNVKQKTLQSVILNDEFISIWKLKKDDIEICKYFKFRCICTDCRAFQENDLNFLKQKKCNYNPYTCEWEEN